MAKRKKHTGRRRRRSVGAMSLNPKSPLMMIAAVAGGYFLADTINPMIDKFYPNAATAPATGFSLSDPNTIKMAGELGLGGYLLLSKGKASLLKTGAGGILAGAGLKRALVKMGVVTGYQSVPVIGRRMGGYQAVPVIGSRTPAQLSGGPAQLQGGFRVNGYQPTGSGVMGKVSGLYEGHGVNGCGSGIANNGSEMMN